MNSTRRAHLSVSIYLSLGGGRFTVNTFCPPNFPMMGIMMENGEVINWDRLCASLCQPHLPKTCNEKWWAPAVHQNLSPSSHPFHSKLQAWEMAPQMKTMEALGGWRYTRAEPGPSDKSTAFPAALPLDRTWRKHCWHRMECCFSDTKAAMNYMYNWIMN